MAESKELATQVPSDEALVERYSQGIAESPMHISRGEAVFVDRYGRPFGRRGFTRIVNMWRVAIWGSMIGGAVLAVSGAWLPGTLLYLASLAPKVHATYRGTSTLMAIDVLARQGYLDEAQRRLDAAPQLRRRNGVAYCTFAGTLASHRGDYATALTWWQEAFPRSKGLARELLKLRIVKAQLLSRRIDEAQRTFETVNMPPESDDVLTGLSLARIMFVLCDPSVSAQHDELHDWARRTLEYSHTGVDLAALGWAFERSGDDDMAKLLAAEALDRMHYPYLATWWPALQQWLDGRREQNAEPPPLPSAS